MASVLRGGNRMKAITIGLFCGWIGYAIAFLIANLFPSLIPWFIGILVILLVICLRWNPEDEDDDR